MLGWLLNLGFAATALESAAVVPAEPTRGGFIYEGEQPYKRRDRERERAERSLDEILRAAYAKVTGEVETPAQAQEVAETVRPYVTGRGRKPVKSAPAIGRVDFAALARDEARAERLLDLAERYMREDEEAAIWLLLMAA